MTRNRRRMLIVSATAGLLSALVWLLFIRQGPLCLLEKAKPYETTYWMPDTGMVPRRQGSRDYWGLGPKAGRDALRLSVGRSASTVTTAHGWNQTLTLDLPSLEAGTVIDLATGDVRVAYDAYLGRQFWNAKPGTVTGTLRVQAVSDDSVAIAYRIELTVLSGSFGGILVDAVHYEGSDVFVRSKRSPDPREMVGGSIQIGPVVDSIHLAAARGDTAAVGKFLARGVDVNTPDASFIQKGWTPLHHAAVEGRPAVVELLLAKGADVNSPDNVDSTPLHHAATRARRDVAELLLDAGADINARNNQTDYGPTPLDMANGWGHETFAKWLIRRGAKPGHW